MITLAQLNAEVCRIDDQVRALRRAVLAPNDPELVQLHREVGRDLLNASCLLAAGRARLCERYIANRKAASAAAPSFPAPSLKT